MDECIPQALSTSLRGGSPRQSARLGPLLPHSPAPRRAAPLPSLLPRPSAGQWGPCARREPQRPAPGTLPSPPPPRTRSGPDRRAGGAGPCGSSAALRAYLAPFAQDLPGPRLYAPEQRVPDHAQHGAAALGTHRPTRGGGGGGATGGDRREQAQPARRGRGAGASGSARGTARAGAGGAGRARREGAGRAPPRPSPAAPRAPGKSRSAGPGRPAGHPSPTPPPRPSLTRWRGACKLSPAKNVGSSGGEPPPPSSVAAAASLVHLGAKLGSPDSSRAFPACRLGLCRGRVLRPPGPVS